MLLMTNKDGKSFEYVAAHELCSTAYIHPDIVSVPPPVSGKNGFFVSIYLDTLVLKLA